MINRYVNINHLLFIFKAVIQETRDSITITTLECLETVQWPETAKMPTTVEMPETVEMPTTNNNIEFRA